MTDSPTNTVNGLWSELFLIENSTNPKELINYWHNLPEEKFDFNAGKERIEVKSSSSFERKHIFSAEQLNPPSDTQVLIASVFLKQYLRDLKTPFLAFSREFELCWIQDSDYQTGIAKIQDLKMV